MLPRIKLQVANNSKELTTAFVVLGIVLLLGAGYVYLTPPVEEPAEPTEPAVETEEFEAFYIDAELVDSAEVVEGSTRYDEGEVLTNWPAYFFDDTPEITLNITTETNTTVDLRKRLVREERVVTTDVSDTDEREGRVIWDNTETLMFRETTTTDGTSADRRTFDVQRDFVNRDASIVPEYSQLGFGSTGSFPAGTEPSDPDLDGFPDSTTELETNFVLTIEYRTAEPIHNETYAGTLEMEPRLEYNEDAYWFVGNQTASVSETQTREVGTSEPSGPTEPVEGEPNIPLVVVLALLGSVLLAGGGVIAKKAPELDRSELRKEVEHNEYSEWISEGELMLDSANEYVYVSSIEDLVNVGIDTDKRVIYDPDLSVYTVTDGDVIYYYSTEPSDIERWAHL